VTESLCAQLPKLGMRWWKRCHCIEWAIALVLQSLLLLLIENAHSHKVSRDINMYNVPRSTTRSPFERQKIMRNVLPSGV